MLLDIIGRIDLDAFIDDEHIKTRRTPSDQGSSETCYAHAIAAVAHMALLRVVDREGGCPSIQDIRDWILHDDNFPVTKEGLNVRTILEGIRTRYRPLCFQEVDEDGARQAVLHRRPVLAAFWLSSNGWDSFSRPFESKATCRSVLTPEKMSPHRRETPDNGGGHAVVLTGCAPGSLTFLNSWGRQWGDHGTFSIRSPSVLEVDGLSKAPMKFYDVYWLESDLTDSEREAYNLKVDEKLRSNSSEYPSILELDICCPLCLEVAPIREFSGNIRQAKCPRCHGSFLPEPGYLVKGLYAQARLGEGG
ncbi:hypothetical protein NCS56_01402900 [Fusarium sp. Ph1]|nr:hypothetical protein NCS56_01402900 [Fusarium sp. Ph1]